jgi:microcystin degradation protein MlrC
MRVFTASLATETNTFSPLPTEMAQFHEAFYAAPGAHPETPTLCSAVIPALRRRAATTPGLEVIEGTATWAEPGGIVRQDVYEALRDEILGQLRAALPVDAVVLGLHGAMVARDEDDCEGDLLARVRDMVGPEVVVAAELDPHSHLTPRRVAAADILAAFLEFPHTDFADRAEHVVDLALSAARGEVRPVISTFDCRMVDVYPTSRAPMRGFVDGMRALQGRDGVLSVSLIHGFMAGDVPEMGTRVMVVTDDAPEAGAALAERLGRDLFALRGTTAMPVLSPADAATRAAAHPAGGKPLVIADIWDNPGGGTAGDNTVLLRALVEAGVTDLGLATLWDPVAANIAHAAGLGVTLEMRLGGKTHVTSGLPFDGRFTVTALADPGWQSFVGSRVTLGRAAALRLEGTDIEIVVNSNRTQTFEPDIFSNLGIDPTAKSVLLVKSTNHFHAGFAPIAAEILWGAVEGPYPTDPSRTPYRKARRDIWPAVADPFGAA